VVKVPVDVRHSYLYIYRYIVFLRKKSCQQLTQTMGFGSVLAQNRIFQLPSCALIALFTVRSETKGLDLHANL